MVHGLGPRYHDQPGRTHADDRPSERGWLDTTDFCPLYTRWIDSKYVSRRRERRPLSYRRCYVVVFSCHPPLRADYGRSCDAETAAAQAGGYHRASLERHTVRHRHGPKGRPTAPEAARLSTHL